jgi:hypothetical protein
MSVHSQAFRLVLNAKGKGHEPCPVPLVSSARLAGRTFVDDPLCPSVQTRAWLRYLVVPGFRRTARREARPVRQGS